MLLHPLLHRPMLMRWCQIGAIVTFAILPISPTLGATQIPSTGWQPQSPVRIERCDAELQIDRNTNTKRISYRHVIRVFNASNHPIQRVDFAVFGIDDVATPVVAMTVTTRWKRPFRAGTSSAGSYTEASTIPRYNRFTPWDLVRHLQCAVTRVYYADRGQWKDPAVIQLSADASPEACVYDVPDGAVAEACDEPSRLTSADMATAIRLQTDASPAARPRIAHARSAKPAPRVIAHITQADAAVDAPTRRDIATPDGRTLSLTVLMGTSSFITDVGPWIRRADVDGVLIVFGEDRMHGVACGPQGVAVDLIFVASDGTITGVASMEPGSTNSDLSRINGFGAFAIGVPAGGAVTHGFVTGQRLPGVL